jgi:DNA-directed RNA polymerase specialized sigma24 family protein
LLALPPRERAALYLHEVEGFRYAEVAEMLGCSEAAAKKAGVRGRRHLVKILEAEVAP